MKKKSSKNKPFRFSYKNSSITAIICFLILALLQLSEPLTQTTAAAAPLPSSTRPIQLYANQIDDNFTKIYTRSIQSAKESITLVIYSLKDPQIISALKERSLEGISVHIVCDAQASKGISKLFENTQAHITRRAGKGLTHQKIMVIDQKQILLGSANLTTDSLETHGNLVFGMENPYLAELVEKKIKSMDEDNGSILLPYSQTQLGQQEIELFILPDATDAIEHIKPLIQSAKKCIQIAMFTWTRRDLAQEVIKAHKRGVKVDVIIDRYSGNGASSKIVQMLSKAGIPVALSTGKGLMHHKFALIDNTTLINGSTNWTINAFTHNDDCFMILHTLTKGQQKKMDSVFKVLKAESQSTIK
jgi:cardiolipin synthase A/B